MKLKFPETLYVTEEKLDEDDAESGTFLQAQDLSDLTEEDEVVAKYQLVSVGKVNIVRHFIEEEGVKKHG